MSSKPRARKRFRRSIFRKTAFIFVIVAMIPTAIIGIRHRQSYAAELQQMVNAGLITQERAGELSIRMRNEALTYAGYAMVIALVVGYFFAGSIVMPIRTLQMGSRRIGSGDLGFRVETDTEDELADLAATINQMASSLQSREREIFNRNRDLSILYDVAHSMSESRELNELLEHALVQAMRVTASAAGCVLLKNRQEELFPVICRGTADGEKSVGPSSGIFDRAAVKATATGRPAVFEFTGDGELLFDSIACIPLKFEGKLQGAVCVTGTKTEFSDDILDLLSAIGSEVAVAIENARLFEKLEEQNRELAEATAAMAGLFTEAEKNRTFGTRYQNPNLVHCWEFKDCGYAACPAYGNRENLRCWQVAGTHCGGEVQGVFAQKLGRCERCEVYRHACPDKITLMGETFNNMMAIMEQRVKEKEELQRQLFSQSKLAAIGELAAGVAHEINNPLTGILASAMLMKARPLAGGEVEKKASVIESEALRAREIVRSLLDFAHQAGNLEREPAHVRTLIEHTLLLMRHQADRIPIRINCHYDDCLPEVEVDINQMKQVFMNLINNAIHAMPEGGMLDIIATTARDRSGRCIVEICFSDTGKGIEKDSVLRVFDPFYTTKPVGEGTGLGLSVSQRIVNDHGGEIKVDSEPEKGSTFTVVLPLPQSGEDRDRHVA